MEIEEWHELGFEAVRVSFDDGSSLVIAFEDYVRAMEVLDEHIETGEMVVVTEPSFMEAEKSNLRMKCPECRSEQVDVSLTASLDGCRLCHHCAIDLLSELNAWKLENADKLLTAGL